MSENLYREYPLITACMDNFYIIITLLLLLMLSKDPTAMAELAVDTPLGVWMSPIIKEFATLRSLIEACKETACRQVIRCSEGTDKIIKDMQEVKSELTTLMSCMGELTKVECIEKRVSKLEEKADIITRDLEKHIASQEEVNAEVKEHISTLETKLADQNVRIEECMSTLEQKIGELLRTNELLESRSRDLQARMDSMVAYRSHSESTSSVSSGYQSSRWSDASINSTIQPAATEAATKARMKKRVKKDVDKAHFLSDEEDN